MDDDKLRTIVADDHPVTVSSTSSLESFYVGLPLPIENLDGINNAMTNQPMSAKSSEMTLPQLKGNVTHPGEPVPQHPEQVVSGLDSRTMQRSNPASTIPSLNLPQNQVPVARSNPLTVAAASGPNSIPEFLFQLTKMLTDDNRNVIEWSNGKIEVHSPHRLESEVLHKYFRHSKFSSFQRQLNYFGFRKLAGKGKMAPCSYVNEAVTSDLTSLLHIKRKTTTAPAKDSKSAKKRDASGKSSRKILSDAASAPPVNPVLAGILVRSGTGSRGGLMSKSLTSRPAAPGTTETYQLVAKAAVGKGIKHSLVNRSTPASLEKKPEPAQRSSSSSTAALCAASYASQEPAIPSIAANSLSQLANNYRISLNDMSVAEALTEGTEPTPLDQLGQGGADNFAGFLSRDSSLVDLAMIPSVDEALPPSSDSRSLGLSFVDFPHPDVYPSSNEDDKVGPNDS